MTIKTAQVLKSFIRDRRFTIKEISQGSGVPASTIAEWANSRVPKNPLQVRKVAEFLGITTHYLLFAEEDDQEPIQKILRNDVFNGTFEISIKRVRLNEK